MKVKKIYMPRVYQYKCSHCDYVFDIGTGELTYGTDKEGKITVGKSAWDFTENKSRKLQVCVCLQCLELIYLIWVSDERVCAKCKSNDIIRIEDLVGSRCPNCDAGTVAKENFGISD